MRGVRGSGSDFFSNLPSNVTENILNCLPLPDAARTSILSKEWRYKWLTIPDIIFDGQICLQFEVNRKLKVIIYQVLLLHNGPIHKFTLSVPNFQSCDEINNWIIFLSKDNVQEFTLRITGDPYKLPSQLFNFQRLCRLNLSYCIFIPPPTFKGFSRLVSLDLQRVIVVPEMFGSLISNSPLLERLTLVGCTNFGCLEIDALKLNFFSFWGHFKSISFKRTPLLAEILLELNDEHHEEGNSSNLLNFFNFVPAIEKLKLGSNILRFLAGGIELKRLPNMLDQLKVLHLSGMHFEKIEDVSCALCLIRSSPKLQKLKISAFTEHIDNMEPVMEYLRAQNFSECTVNRLQNIKITLFSGVRPEMEFVKILLACAPVLKKLVIYTHEEVCDGESWMLKELKVLPRASPRAEIIFIDS